MIYVHGHMMLCLKERYKDRYLYILEYKTENNSSKNSDFLFVGSFQFYRKHFITVIMTFISEIINPRLATLVEGVSIQIP